jgi:CRISPR-associated protein Cas1
MPYRNIFIANESKMKLKNNQLIIFNGEEYSFPIEDIRSIVVDTPYSTLSAKLISYLGEQGVCLILCDEKHTPVAQLSPIGTYCRSLKRLELQISQSKPKLKRIWQQIIIKKIENQAECLKINNIDNTKLISISKSVQSGDTNNREGYAANVYFKYLFGKDFTRDQESIVNAALNYGYAIIRSFIAKNIVSYGLEPSIGIHHKNQLNSFNLADDLIEPFRPVVDIFVSQNYKKWEDDFSTYQKAQLQKLLNSVVSVNNENWSVSKAIELLIQSLVSSFENEKIQLKLPDVINTCYFDYE